MLDVSSCFRNECFTNSHECIIRFASAEKWFLYLHWISIISINVLSCNWTDCYAPTFPIPLSLFLDDRRTISQISFYFIWRDYGIIFFRARVSSCLTWLEKRELWMQMEVEFCECSIIIGDSYCIGNRGMLHNSWEENRILCQTKFRSIFIYIINSCRDQITRDSLITGTSFIAKDLRWLISEIQAKMVNLRDGYWTIQSTDATR